MRIYISIPITGHDLMTQTGIALEIAEKIKALGHEPVNPFDTPLAPPECPCHPSCWRRLRQKFMNNGSSRCDTIMITKYVEVKKIEY